MADIINFPTMSKHEAVSATVPTTVIEFPIKPKSSVGQVGAGMAHFRAELFLIDGKNVAFSLLYPSGRVSSTLVAAMLRKAALMLDNQNHH